MEEENKLDVVSIRLTKEQLVEKVEYMITEEEYKQYNREIDQYIEEYYKQHKNAEVDAYRNTDKWK